MSAAAGGDAIDVYKKPAAKTAEVRAAVNPTSMSAPAAYPATRFNRNHVATSTSVKLNSKDRLNKEALKKRLELQKQSQQLLEKQIEQQKVRYSFILFLTLL